MVRARVWRGALLPGLVLLMGSSVACGTTHAHAKSHKAKPAAPTPASLAQARQKLEQQQTQVKQLQDTLAKQESDSKQASERLQQQDQAISKMQQELKALNAKPAPTQH
jgi:septal ring factor EnvC (AmiA/AmiB activator)